MRALFLIALLAAAAPAAAQYRVLPQRYYWTEAELSQAATRKLVADFAKCTVRWRPAKAAVFVLETRPEAQDISFLDGDCLGRSRPRLQLRLHHDGMAYVLADELARRDGSTLAGLIGGAGPIAHREFVELPAPPEFAGDPAKLATWKAGRERSRAYGLLSRFGECVVRTAPNQSAALISTNVASEAEQAAFEALAPALSQCVEMGGKLALNKFTLRGTVAVNLYRLARAPRILAAGAPK